jgi:hypothetical protein
VLDIAAIASIIYIWYEGGELRPSLARLDKPRRFVESSSSSFRDEWEVPKCEAPVFE